MTADLAVTTVGLDTKIAVGVMTIDRPAVDTVVYGTGRALVTADLTHLDAHGVITSLRSAEEVAPEVEESIVVEEAACPREIMPGVDREQTHRHGNGVDVAYRDMII